MVTIYQFFVLISECVFLLCHSCREVVVVSLRVSMFYAP